MASVPCAASVAAQTPNCSMQVPEEENRPPWAAGIATILPGRADLLAARTSIPHARARRFGRTCRLCRKRAASGQAAAMRGTLVTGGSGVGVGADEWPMCLMNWVLANFPTPDEDGRAHGLWRMRYAVAAPQLRSCFRVRKRGSLRPRAALPAGAIAPRLWPTCEPCARVKPRVEKFAARDRFRGRPA
jgi:hypothetical protein